MAHKNSIILYPILSEKSTALSEDLHKYSFCVDKGSNKLEIKKAVEERFNVKVKKVATINVKGKQKNMTMRSSGHVIRTTGYRASWKKAIVTMEEGHSIDIVGGEV